MSSVALGLNFDSILNTLLTLICVSMAGIVGLALYFHTMTRQPRVNLPIPPLEPITGHLIMSIKNADTKLHWLLDLHETLGDTFALCVPQFTGAPPIVVTANPDNIEHILKTHFEVYDKGPVVHENLVAFLGNGIFAVDGWQWKQQRKIASHIFTVKHFRDLFEGIFVQETGELVACLREAARVGDTVDMLTLFYNFTMDTFGRIGFGVDFQCLKAVKPKPFATAFDKVQSIVTNRFLNPFWNITEHLDGTRSIFRRNLNMIDTFANQVIQDRLDQLQNGTHATLSHEESAKKGDLLDLFMNVAKNQDNENEPLSKKELRDIVLSFIIAGRDTTAQALSWCLWQLCLHPDIETKVRSEFVQVLGNENIPNLETIKELKYAHAFFYEILRLYPSVPANMKTTNKADVLPDGTHLPADTLINYSPWVMGRLERIWGPDCKQVKPERWLDDKGNLKKESPSKWPAFHAGPRTCLGQQLATNEAITVLSILLRKFKFILLPGQEEKMYGPSLTLPMRDPLMMKVELRE